MCVRTWVCKICRPDWPVDSPHPERWGAERVAVRILPRTPPSAVLSLSGPCTGLSVGPRKIPRPIRGPPGGLRALRGPLGPTIETNATNNRWLPPGDHLISDELSHGDKFSDHCGNAPKSAQNRSESLCAGVRVPCPVFLGSVLLPFSLNSAPKSKIPGRIL